MKAVLALVLLCSPALAHTGAAPRWEQICTDWRTEPVAVTLSPHMVHVTTRSWCARRATVCVLDLRNVSPKLCRSHK